MKRMFIVTLLLILLVGVVGCKSQVKWNNSIVYNHVSMVFDETDMYQYVGVVDYIFVGEVIDANQRLKDVTEKSTYKIKVVENLKGQLVENIECDKYGGYLKDGTMVLLESDNTRESGLLEIGNTYIIMAYGQNDGSLLISEFYSNTIYNQDNLNDYKDYIQNEVTMDRMRSICKYDINY